MQNIGSPIGSIDLFKTLSLPERRRLEMATRRLALGKGEVLFRSGDTPGHVFYVIEGTISQSLLSPLGTEKVVEIMREGAIFGAESVLLNKPHCMTAQALQACDLLQIRRDAFVSCVEQNHDIALQMMHGFGGRLHGYIKDIESYSLCSAVQRVADFLLAEAAAQHQGEEEAVVDLQVSKAVMASRLNLAPETLSRTFKILSGKGFITVRGTQIAVHGQSRLRKACSEAEMAATTKSEPLRAAIHW